MADLDASVAWAAQHGGDGNLVRVTGFCWGGRLTWMYTAHSLKVKAGVAWYGRLTVGHGPLIKRNAVDITKELHGPVLGLYGAQDTSIPLNDVNLMKQRLAEGNEYAKASRIDVYPDSGHAFLADYRSSYNEKDAKDGWKKMVDWFAKYLK